MVYWLIGLKLILHIIKERENDLGIHSIVSTLFDCVVDSQYYVLLWSGTHNLLAALKYLLKTTYNDHINSF